MTIGSLERLVLSVVLAVAMVVPVAARTKLSNVQLSIALDRNFSPIPFGTRRAPASLKRLGQGSCAKGGSCVWTDTRGVVHCFCDEQGGSGGDNSLFSKHVSASDFPKRPIPVLGIGTARLQRDVLERVRRTFPDLAMSCDTQDSTYAISCAGSAEDGALLVIGFDRRHRLVDVILYAYSD